MTLSIAREWGLDIGLTCSCLCGISLSQTQFSFQSSRPSATKLASTSSSSTFVTPAGGLEFQFCLVQWGTEVNASFIESLRKWVGNVCVCKLGSCNHSESHPLRTLHLEGWEEAKGIPVCLTNRGLRELVLSVWEQGPFWSHTDSGMWVLSLENGIQVPYCSMTHGPAVALDCNPTWFGHQLRGAEQWLG